MSLSLTKEGQTVAGLEPKDFALLDNEQPQNIFSFQAVDGKTTKPDPPVEVILVIDTMNLPASQVPLAKNEAEKFLRRNHGSILPNLCRFTFFPARVFRLCPDPPLMETPWLTRSLVDESYR